MLPFQNLKKTCLVRTQTYQAWTQLRCQPVRRWMERLSPLEEPLFLGKPHLRDSVRNA